MTPSTEAGQSVVPEQRSGDDESPASAKGKGGKSGKGKSALGGVEEYLPDRREALFLLGGGVLGAALGAGGIKYTSGVASLPDRNDAVEVTSKMAREMLEAGNLRYLAGQPMRPDQTLVRRQVVAAGQHPFAAVLSCADSRVPPEVLFDQGLGDLFVVRSAGQVLDQAVLGSIQYGVEHLTTPLLVVLGHSECGAVKATIEAIETKAKPSGTAIDDLVTAIKPAVVEAEEIGAEEEKLVEVAISVNVERIVEALKQDHVIGEAVSKRTLKVVGAIYDLTTGEVDWL